MVISKNKIILILCISILFGCSPKISEHFKQNRFIEDFNIHVINDSLQLYYKSPADISYVTRNKDLKKVIRKKNFKLKDKVLVYGITDDPPYEYFVTLSHPNNQAYPRDLIVLDTIIDDKMFRFIGNALLPKSYNNLEADLYDMMNSIVIGPNYRKQVKTIINGKK